MHSSNHLWLRGVFQHQLGGRQLFSLSTWWLLGVVPHLPSGRQVVRCVFQSMFLLNPLTKLSLHVLDINFILVYSVLDKCIIQQGWRLLLIFEFLFALTFLLFGRCKMFLFLMQKCGVGLFNLVLEKLKNSWFLVSMVSFVIFQSVPFFKGISERLGKT